MDPSMDDPMSDEEDGDNSRASGGGGAMDDDVLEGEQIAEEDVYEYGDPNDPLDRVLDVYLAEELEDNLWVDCFDLAYTWFWWWAFGMILQYNY